MIGKVKKGNLLDYIPSRDSELGWDQAENGVVTLHRENAGFYNRLAQRFFRRPPVSHIRLEPYGSFLWCKMDGKRSVGELALLLREQFGKEVEPLYPRIGQYLRIMKNNGFIRLNKEIVR